MTDDKTKNDARDRNQVAGGEDYEIEYIAKKLGVSTEQVREAIKVVGNDRNKVEEYLTGNKN